MPDPSAPRTVQCYHCRKLFDVPPRAMSISCPWCYKRVGLDDMMIRGTCWTSRLQTCGRITVKPGAVLMASLVEASHGIDVYGTAEGELISAGQILIGPKAHVRGRLRAANLHIENGGQFEGSFVQTRAPRMDASTPRPAPPRPAMNPEFRSTIRLPGWLRGARTT